MITISQTLTNLSADFKRRLQLEELSPNLLSALRVAFKPGMISVVLYRLSRFCYYNRLRIFCKLFILIDQIINTSEISPLADIGPGLVLSDAGGIGVPSVCIMGKNCTFMGCASITLGVLEDTPSEQDHILFGDHCVIGCHTRFMRPINLANGTQIKPCSVVITSVSKEGQTISGIPAKRKNIDDYEKIKQWNPLQGKLLKGVFK